jgi:NADPH2:quinone reductase
MNAGGRALTVDSFDGPEAIELRERPLLEPGPGEVLVWMRACGIHPLESLIAAGGIPFAKRPPLVLGAVGGGVVAGDGERFARGDRVAVLGNEMGMLIDGIWADQAAVPERLLLELPDGVGFEEAACLGVAPPTAALALDLAAAPAGGKVLVLGATGAVGSAAVQLAAAAGLVPVAASRSSSGCEFAASLGAAATVDLSTQSFEEAAEKLTEGGFDAIIDPLGGPLTAAALKALAPGRNQVVLGYSSGFETTVSLPDLVMTGRSIRGGSMNVAGPAGLRAAEERCLAALADGSLRTPLAGRFGFDELDAALATAADPAVFGRTILVP